MMTKGKGLLHKSYQLIDKCIFRYCSKTRSLEESLYNYYCKKGVPKAISFDFCQIKSKTLAFVASMKVGDHIAEYKYSPSTIKANIYASAYACMIRSLYKDLESITETQRQDWLEYFDFFQSPNDGLFRDPNIMNNLFESEDWWGARHLACHLIIAYTALGGKPKYDFHFLEPFYNSHCVVKWLESRDWVNRLDFVGNEVMNYGVLLQYSRDFFENQAAGVGITTMMKWLYKHIDSKTGLWGQGPFDTAEKLSKAVQAAYHIYPLFFYDNWDIPYKEQLIDHILRTQNKLGGYGVLLNSSACEDIDSIDLLIRLSQRTMYRHADIFQSLLRAFPWVLANMNDDGGFAFRRNERFVYGHPEMSSGPNESSMFATWFRTLSLAYIINFLFGKRYFIKKVPGYEFD